MSAPELVLLSPYRLPAQYALTLADDDMASWLNGYSALCHPAALWQAGAPVRVDPPYDHENPRPGHIYAAPQAPPSQLPDERERRVRAAGPAAVPATQHR